MSKVQTLITLPTAVPTTGMLQVQTLPTASPSAESESVVPTVSWPGNGEKKKAAKMQPKGICTAR